MKHQSNKTTNQQMSEKMKMLTGMEYEVNLLRGSVNEILSILVSNDKQNLSTRIIEQLSKANSVLEDLKKNFKKDDIQELLSKIDSLNPYF